MGGGNSGFDKDAHEEKAMRAQIKDVSDSIRDQDSESLYVIDKDGNILGSINGGEHEVGSDDLNELSRWNIVVHNHPEGGTFTPKDILQHIENGSRELYAVSSRWNYRIRPMSRRHAENAIQFYQAFDKADREFSAKAEQDFMETAKSHPSMFRNFESVYHRWVLARWDKYSHQWLQKNASKYGYEYSKTSVKRRR